MARTSHSTYARDAGRRLRAEARATGVRVRIPRGASVRETRAILSSRRATSWS